MVQVKILRTKSEWNFIYRKAAVLDYFKERFHNLHVQGGAKKKLKKDDNFSSFETCATDTESIKKIEFALQRKLYEELLKVLNL